jgi:hypothetical protein
VPRQPRLAGFAAAESAPNVASVVARHLFRSADARDFCIWALRALVQRRGIHYNPADVCAVFGVRTRGSARGDGLRAELLAEAGPLLGDASLSGVGQLVPSFRVGASGVLGWQIRPERLIIRVRGSGSYTPWNGAGGPF